MHTMWKGSISFGLVNIPVRMFAATEDKDIRFRNIHKECHTPIKYEQTCPSCNKKVNADEIVKGFEYEPGRFVVIEDPDLDAIRPDITKSIEIIDFVLLKDIDPIYYTRSYYLSPQDTGGKAYNLLREAMNKTGRIAMARIVIREKESLAVVRVYKNLLVLETIYYPDEVRDSKQVPGISDNVSVNEAELNMATQLIGNLTHEFEPEKYKNEYRDKLMDLISKKAEGDEIVTMPEIRKTNVIDLMQALQASLKQTQASYRQETEDNKDNKQQKDEDKPAAKRKKKATATV
ncbi:MAG: Ku protein [Ruminiclostridium sp.]|nr:Ku protein [Ruminiclostridium sp.]